MHLSVFIDFRDKNGLRPHFFILPRPVLLFTLTLARSVIGLSIMNGLKKPPFSLFS